MNEPLPLLIERVPAPRWINSANFHHQGVYDVLGEQAEWGFAIPWVYRTLASPLTREPILEAPKPGDDIMRGPLAYWSALLHLMIYGFGWVRPDAGLRWWYEAGKPVTDYRLQLMSQIWDADGQLDWFAAWLWTPHPILNDTLLEEATGYLNQMPLQFDNDGEAAQDRWIQARRSEAEASGIPAPIGQGWDELHLSAHINGPLESATGRSVLSKSRADRRAVLLLDSMTGWYRALASEGKALPKLSGHSWRVDVVVKPVGWLGTYRRSSVTGLWFAGSHRVHLKGV